MPIPMTGPISLAGLQAEFGGATPTGMAEYYRGAAYVPSNLAAGPYGPVPTSGAISINKFRGTAKNQLDTGTPALVLSRNFSASVTAPKGAPVTLYLAFERDGWVVAYGAGTSQYVDAWYRATNYPSFGASWYVLFTRQSGAVHTIGPTIGSSIGDGKYQRVDGTAAGMPYKSYIGYQNDTGIANVSGSWYIRIAPSPGPVLGPSEPVYEPVWNIAYTFNVSIIRV